MPLERPELTDLDARLIADIESRLAGHRSPPPALLPGRADAGALGRPPRALRVPGLDRAAGVPGHGGERRAGALGGDLGRRARGRHSRHWLAGADRHDGHGGAGRHGVALRRAAGLRVDRRGHPGRRGRHLSRCARAPPAPPAMRRSIRQTLPRLPDRRPGLGRHGLDGTRRRRGRGGRRLAAHAAAGPAGLAAPGRHGGRLRALGALRTRRRQPRLGARSRLRARHRYGVFHDGRCDRRRHSRSRGGHGRPGLYRRAPPGDRGRHRRRARGRGAGLHDQQRDAEHPSGARTRSRPSSPTSSGARASPAAPS